MKRIINVASASLAIALIQISIYWLISFFTDIITPENYIVELIKTFIGYFFWLMVGMKLSRR